MPDLPARPNLDQLRHQAKDLLRDARAGDPSARERIRVVSSAEPTLAAAQLAVAREYGFASWPALKAEVNARAGDIAGAVEAFLVASVRGPIARAARMLAETPEIADSGFAAALVLGDVERVRESLAHEPELATAVDPRWGWTALQAVCSSRWYHLDPERGEGLLACARVLLDAGAAVAAASGPRGRQAWRPLGCAVAATNAGPSNERMIRLLLDHGATPTDDNLYLVAFASDDHRSMRALLEHTPDVAAIARQALSGPIGARDLEGLRLMLEAGADPNRYLNDDGEPGSPLYDVLRARAGIDAMELLLAFGADPTTPGPDGRTAYRVATAAGMTEVVELLRRYGAPDDATATDRFLGAVRHADGDAARRQLAENPGLVAGLGVEDQGAIASAAEAGDTEAVRLMLDLGFPTEVHGGAFDGTALHAAAYAGSAGTVRLLLQRGADLEAKDARWDSPPLGWALVGSGERPDMNPDPDWVGAVRALLDAGASLAEVSLDPGDDKPPSPEVAALVAEAMRSREG